MFLTKMKVGPSFNVFNKLKNKHFNPNMMSLGSFLCFQWIVNMEEEQHFEKFSCILKNTNEMIFIPKILQCFGIQISMAILQQCFHANQRKVTRLDKSFISKQITGFFLKNRGPFLVSSCVCLYVCENLDNA